MQHADSRRGVRRNLSLVLVVAAALISACGGSKSAAPTQLTLNTGSAPWPNPDHASKRVAAAGLIGTPSESLAVHYHVHLDILVNGRAEPVAASIGRDDDSFFSPLHTHATSGMIHIEAPSDQTFTLGMLFTEWGVRLDGNCVGGYCEPAMPIVAYVDGHRSSDAVSAIVFRKGEEIALVIGEPPSVIPSRWDCRAKIDPHVENPAQCADFSS
jgi:hypothetical protein